MEKNSLATDGACRDSWEDYLLWSEQDGEIRYRG